MSEKRKSAKRERELFAELVQIESAEGRIAFLDGVCPDDSVLRRRLEILLEGHFQTGHFLQTFQTEDADDRHSAPEQAGSQIGRYKLLQEIGEGGFGTVYMAEQQEPMVRKVALKIIKLGMDTKQVIARFESERQALALMDHPNIAKVLDAGSTETGRPYFVMELIKGMPITQFCDERRYSTEARLAMFKQVCDAVQHAHQKGIIHRDLKPSNVLVTLHGDEPVVKVIDFGIAKATEHRLTDKTLFTQFQHFIGTPAYMSPEQASLSGLDIDTRSDVYSLGVLLYELLVGKTPFDPRTLLEKGYDEIRRVIREEEAPRPSNRLHTLSGEEQTETATKRSSDSRHLSQLLRGELDWIVLKSLEKDRTRRYRTASELAEDIHRFLFNEPVSALAPKASYRFRKFALRNKAALVTATAFVVVLLVSSIVSIQQAWKATTANQEAETANQKLTEQLRISTTAQQESETARSLAQSNIRRWALQQGREALRQEKYSTALPYLVQAVRSDPTDRVAAGQLAVALMQGKFATPLTAPLKTPHQVQLSRFSPDGRYLAAVHGPCCGSLTVWNAETGARIGVPIEEGNNLYLGEFTPDGSRLLAFDRDQIYVMSVSALDRVERTISFDEGSGISAIQVSPDGKRVGVGFYKGMARFYEFPSGKPLSAGMRLGQSVLSCDFSDDGELFAISSKGAGRVFNAVTAEPVSPLMTHPSIGSKVSFIPGEQRLLYTGAGFAYLWDARTGELLNPETAVDPRFQFVRYSPCGQMATSHQGNDVFVWNRELTQLKGASLRHPAPVLAAWFNPSGTQILVNCKDRYSYLWDEHLRELVLEPFSDGNPSHKVAFSADGSKLANFGWFNEISVWSASSPGWQGHDISVEEPMLVGEAEFSPDNRWILLGGPEMAQLVRATTGEAIGDPLPHYCWVARRPVFSQDSKFFALLQQHQRSIQLYSVPQARPLLPPFKHETSIGEYEISPDSRLLVTGDTGGNVNVWNVETGERMPLALKHDSSTQAVRFSSDSRYCASTSTEGKTVVWRLEDGAEMFVSEPLHQTSASVYFHPTEDIIFTLSHPEEDAPTLRASNWRTGESLWKIQADEHVIRPWKVSGDGRWILTGGVDGTSNLFDTRRGRRHGIDLVHGHVNDGVTFGPFSRLAATASYDGSARLWDVDSSHLVATLCQSDDALGSAKFSHDGRFVISSGNDSVYRIRGVPDLTEPFLESLLDLSEGIAGGRIAANGELVPLSYQERIRRRGLATQATGDGYYAQLTQWLLTTPLERALIPGAVLTTRQKIEQVVESAPLPEVYRALQVSQTSGRVLTRLARAIVEERATSNSPGFRRASFLLDFARRWNSETTDIRFTEALLKYRVGHTAESLTLLQKLLDDYPDHERSLKLLPELLAARKRYEEAVEALDVSVNHTQAVSESEQREAWMRRAAWLAATGEIEEAKDSQRRALSLPERNHALSSQHLDLTLFYNANLEESWLNLPSVARDLSGFLDHRNDRFDGIQFDARGIAQLYGGSSLEVSRYPKGIREIPVGQAFRKIHVLHGLANSGARRIEASEAWTMARYILRYQDGTEYAIDVRAGEHLGDWIYSPSSDGENGASATGNMVWTKEDPSGVGHQRLFKSSWINPQPEKLVESIDLESANDAGGVFVLGISVE